MTKKWDAIIIGGGLSGLCVGALLASSEKKVLILEKEKQPAGRAISITYKGHIFDNGTHDLLLNGFLEKIYDRIGKPFPAVVPLKNIQILYEGEFRKPMEICPRSELRRIFDSILQTSYAQLEELDDTTLPDWVSKQTSNDAIHHFFHYTGYLAAVGSKYENISAGDILSYLKEMLELPGGFSNMAGLVRGGFRSLTDPLIEAINERGGEIRTNARVSDVVVKRGQVQGVKVESGERVLSSHLVDVDLLEAPIVIITVPIWDLFNVIPEEEFPTWYIEWVDAIKKKVSNVWTLMCGLDKPLWDEYITRWIPNSPRVGLPWGAAHHPTYGEGAGEYQLQFWFQPQWGEAPNLLEFSKARVARGVRQMYDLWEEDINQVFPDLKKHLIWKVRLASIYSIAESPGTVGRHRLDVQTPVKGLYLSSDTLQHTRPVGCQSVARCALRCVDKILANE